MLHVMQKEKRKSRLKSIEIGTNEDRSVLCGAVFLLIFFETPNSFSTLALKHECLKLSPQYVCVCFVYFVL